MSPLARGPARRAGIDSRANAVKSRQRDWSFNAVRTEATA